MYKDIRTIQEAVDLHKRTIRFIHLKTTFHDLFSSLLFKFVLEILMPTINLSGY